MMHFVLTTATGWTSVVHNCQDGKLPVLSLFTGIAGLETGLAESGAELWFQDVSHASVHLSSAKVSSFGFKGMFTLKVRCVDWLLKLLQKHSCTFGLNALLNLQQQRNSTL